MSSARGAQRRHIVPSGPRRPRITRDIPRENRRQLALDMLRSHAGSPGVEWRAYHRPFIVEFCPYRCDQPSTQGLIPGTSLTIRCTWLMSGIGPEAAVDRVSTLILRPLYNDLSIPLRWPSVEQHVGKSNLLVQQAGDRRGRQTGEIPSPSSIRPRAPSSRR
jgi:hypothetical protein